ncbi:unnamed protein product [Cylicostephanus goldi]|uniref:Uncharacterized protein n=1 Tax=Cylicostephanus goldi TaxID=71465 RepID=A0A3P7PQ98_CYLGO|nr:unnamed protein product [Cylicostephanus goldi]
MMIHQPIVIGLRVVVVRVAFAYTRKSPIRTRLRDNFPTVRGDRRPINDAALTLLLSSSVTIIAFDQTRADFRRQRSFSSFKLTLEGIFPFLD